MILFLKIFFTEFIAEMGDKTQLMLIALTSKYKLRDIICGTAIAILVLNGLAVLAGGLVSELIPEWLIKMIAAFAFLYFAASTIAGDEEEEEEDEDDEKASEELRSRKKAALVEKKKREEQEMTEQLRAADQKTAEEEKQDEFEIPDLEEEGTEQVSFNTVDLQNLVRGEETEEIPEAVEETKIVEEAAAEETAEEVTEETEETESAEPETVEEIEEFEETIEEPEEEPEPEPSEPIELAMPVYTAEELLQKAHAAGDDPKVIEDPATGITILDYSDIL